MDQNTLLADAVTKAIAYTENGGSPDIHNPKKGKTGEAKSIFQYTPDTWKIRAKQFLGDENAPITADNETFVTQQQVHKWLQDGKSISQIASMWNAGSGEPDAYKGKFSTGKSSVGINEKFKQKYDVPAYARKVEDYTKQFLLEHHTKETDMSNSPIKPLMDVVGAVSNSIKTGSPEAPSPEAPSAPGLLPLEQPQNNAPNKSPKPVGSV